MYNSVNSCSSVTLASITDGTSNTIAFGEGLVGDYGRNNNYRGNGMSGAPIHRWDCPVQRCPAITRRSNPAAVLQALQSCNAFWKSTALATCVRVYCM